MDPDMTHVEFARNNEELSEDFHDSFPEQNNWVVTLYFYSYLHYVEEVLTQHGYRSSSHNEREDNISECSYIDRQCYKIYRSLYDTSRDARYECIKIDEDSVDKCRERMLDGKEALGFSEGGGSTKYST